MVEVQKDGRTIMDCVLANINNILDAIQQKGLKILETNILFEEKKVVIKVQ